MTPIVIIKTAALGDVLRTTSILPGLHERYEGCRVTWITSPSAVDLLRTHPLIRAVETVDPASDAGMADVTKRLSATRWARIISLDDEAGLCRLASALPCKRLSGAHVRSNGRPAYTPDTAPWFDMGLLSDRGKAAADRLKLENRKSHPQIHAEMLGLRMGKPELHLPEDSRTFARTFADRSDLEARGPVVGLNTGAGGRWTSKQIPVERTVELAARIHGALAGKVTFLVFGGEAEAERNRRILEGLGKAAGGPRAVDAGTDNGLLDFAGLIGLCDVVVSSDSLALHVCVALGVRVVAFFAPTSAAEIELYGRGEKVRSTAADYCSYRPDADNSTITPERLATTLLRQLEEAARERGKGKA